jgi:hypothetical protein
VDSRLDVTAVDWNSSSDPPIAVVRFLWKKP